MKISRLSKDINKNDKAKDYTTIFIDHEIDTESVRAKASIDDEIGLNEVEWGVLNAERGLDLDKYKRLFLDNFWLMRLTRYLNAYSFPYRDMDEVINNAFILDTYRRNSSLRRTVRLENGDLILYKPNTRGIERSKSSIYIDYSYRAFTDFMGVNNNNIIL